MSLARDLYIAAVLSESQRTSALAIAQKRRYWWRFFWFTFLTLLTSISSAQDRYREFEEDYCCGDASSRGSSDLSDLFLMICFFIGIPLGWARFVLWVDSRLPIGNTLVWLTYGALVLLCFQGLPAVLLAVLWFFIFNYGIE